MALQTLSYKPLYLLLADHLETRILSGEFPYDSFLPPMRTLMGTFNVSLATVRGALLLLEEKNLVKRKQGSGIRVIHRIDTSVLPSPKVSLDISRDIQELFDLRAILEPAALDNGFNILDRESLKDLLNRFGSSSRENLYMLDRALHEQISECPNRYIRQALSDVMNRIELYREIKFRNIDTAGAGDFKCISQIASYIINNKRRDARELLKKHIIKTRDGLLSHIE